MQLDNYTSNILQSDVSSHLKTDHCKSVIKIENLKEDDFKSALITSQHRLLTVSSHMPWF